MSVLSPVTQVTPLQTDAEVAALVTAFDAATVPREAWTHAAHLTVAVAYVQRLGPGALDALRVGIGRLNAVHGTVQTESGGYHETLTVFYTWAVAREVARAPMGLGPAELANRVVCALADRTIPLGHWSRPRLMSWAARMGWVEPDLRPLEAGPAHE